MQTSENKHKARPATSHNSRLQKPGLCLYAIACPTSFVQLLTFTVR